MTPDRPPGEQGKSDKCQQCGGTGEVMQWDDSGLYRWVLCPKCKKRCEHQYARPSGICFKCGKREPEPDFYKEHP